MARLKLEQPIIAETKAGEAINLAAQNIQNDENPAAFQTIEPGFYTGIVSKIEESIYRAKFGDRKNTEEKDGLWSYLKFIPHVRLTNENGTLINRQGYTVGVQNAAGVLIRPDNDKKKSPIFGGKNGAQFFLQALGLFRKAGDDQPGFLVDFDPVLVEDRVVRVHVATAGYIKNVTSFTTIEFAQLMTDLYGSENYTFNDVPAIVAKYNQEHGYIDAEGKEVEEGVRLKTKNEITSWYSLYRKQAEEAGYYFDLKTGQVFQTEASFHKYVELNSVSGDGQNPKW